MGKSKIDSKPLRLRLSERGEIAKVRAAARVIEEMNKAGISADGSPFPDGKTREITMHDSGLLHRDFEAYTTRLQYRQPYARHLQSKYNWCGIPGDGPWRERFEKLVQEELNSNLLQE